MSPAQLQAIIDILNADFNVSEPLTDTSTVAKIQAVLEPEIAGHKTEACYFVAATELIGTLPAEIADDFWAKFADRAPFDWGSNNRSLITASRFAEHCQIMFANWDITGPEAETFIKLLYELGETYIDLES